MKVDESTDFCNEMRALRPPGPRGRHTRKDMGGG